MSELVGKSQRGASYRVELEPTLLNGEPDGWARLTVFDVNSVIMHATFLRADDAPQEVAVAVERAERMRLESMFPKPKAKR